MIVCDFTVECINESLDKLLNDSDVDIVVAHGIIGSNELARRKKLKKPALAPFMIDPRSQGLDPRRVPKNLAYILWPGQLARDLGLLAQLVPFKTVVLLISSKTEAALPESLKEHLINEAKSAGVSLSIISAPPQADETLSLIPANAQAVYAGPMFEMNATEYAQLAQGLKERKLPSFSWAGEAGVKAGYLAGVSSKNDVKKLARRFALALQSLLLGDRPDSVHSKASLPEGLYFNASTAQALQISPNLQTLLNITVIGQASAIEQDPQGSVKSISLQEAVQEALKASLSLAAADQGVLVAGQEARRARAALLPQLGVAAEIRKIDADSIGPASAESQASWNAQASQLIYGERQWGAFAASKWGARAEQERRESTRLDTIRDVSTAYLQLLQAHTIQRVQESDLKLSRENLEMARIRFRVGQAGREEVYRWEARIAQSQQKLLSANAQNNQARVSLNVLMNRKAEEQFSPVAVTLETPGLLTSDPRFRGYLQSPRHFQVLQTFLAQVGLKNSPELRKLESEMAGVRRQVQAERRSYYVPSFTAGGVFSHRFYSAGAEFAFPGLEIDKFNYQVGVSAELPFFEGGLKDANIDKGNAQYSQLSLTKQLFARQVEQAVRQSLYSAAASYASITLTRESKTASEGNLKIVQDQYQRGRSTIIQLIDAQNQAIVAESESSNAVFAFLSDLMNVERATGRFGFLSGSQALDNLLNDLDRLTLREGLKPPALASAPDAIELPPLEETIRDSSDSAAP